MGDQNLGKVIKIIIMSLMPVLSLKEHIWVPGGLVRGKDRGLWDLGETITFPSMNECIIHPPELLFHICTI